MCGGNFAVGVGNPAGRGLSPRVRGKPWSLPSSVSILGSIPACAGETTPASGLTGRPGGYPRVCGGNRLQSTSPSAPRGLSPRVRGKLPSPRPLPATPWSIPACAGETNWQIKQCLTPEVYPRVCGGNQLTVVAHPLQRGLSPRVRGKPCAPLNMPSATRSIPACAGETRPPVSPFPCPWVYPRVCGGNPATGAPPSPSAGLSPRVRGKQ